MLVSLLDLGCVVHLVKESLWATSLSLLYMNLMKEEVFLCGRRISWSL